jgi:predicted alpha-1,2-mannosidase
MNLRKKLIRLLGIVVLLTTMVGSNCAQSNIKRDKQLDNLQFVDPTIGNVGHLLQPTRPTVQLPNQALRMFPMRNDHLDDRIRFFPLNLKSHRLGELFAFMPFTGEVQGQPISAWDEQLEQTTPYYYSTWLEDYNVTVEFTVGAKVGFYRLTFHDNQEKKVFLQNLNNGNLVLNDAELKGVEHFEGMSAYLTGEFSSPLQVIHSAKLKNRSAEWLLATEKASNQLLFKYAISYIDHEQAQQNLKNEIPGWDFEGTKTHARNEWSKVMNQIEVKGGSEAHKRTFYTALYRCYERMVNISEEGRYYSGYDNQVHESDRDFYVDDWVWDTYLVHHPLRAILHPEQEGDMMHSFVKMYEQSGWMPTFPVIYGDHVCMNGFHSTISLWDAWIKDIRNFDLEKAYEGAYKNATQATMLPWRNGPKCQLDDFYAEKGFYPALKPGEKETEPMVHSFEKRQSVAITLGHSYDDWALAQMAKELGKTEDYKKFISRSNNFKNLWSTDDLLFMPKDKKGSWIDIDPKFDGGMGARDYYDENNGWTYQWQVQHDIPALIELMGGKDGFEDRLDQMFRESLERSKYEFWAKLPDATGLVGQFSMGNEPSFHIPYLYNFTNSPWKTQKKIRMLIDTWYDDNIFGIPGDEDGGGMTAFVVFSQMGFYPITPGMPVYTIGTPFFEEIKIHLENGKVFTIKAHDFSVTNKYIQSATLNGKPLNTPFFSHEELMKGALLEFEMGPYPNKVWGH